MKKKHSRVVALAAGVALLSLAPRAQALTWKGHTWNVTNGGMAGKCQGSPNNVFVDASGYLHLKITNNGGTWTAAEVFSADKLGFGTYQWQIDGAIDRFEPWIVLGMFPYGPAAGIGGDGTNEIDIEYSVWGHAGGPNGDWTDYPASGTTIGEQTYTFSLGGGTLSTSRFTWNETSITSSLLAPLVPVGSTNGLIKTWTYAPTNPTKNIPQQALPLGMNLWCFQGPPAGAQNVEIVIRDFELVPNGTSGGGGTGNGGTMGTAGTTGAAGSAGSAGATGAAGTSGGAGTSGAAGTTGGAGTTGAAGAVGVAGSTGNGGSAGVSAAGAAGTTSGDAGTTGAAGTSSAAGSSTGGVGAGQSGSTGSTSTAGAPGQTSGATADSGCACSAARAEPTRLPWLALLAALVVATTRRPRARG